MQGGVSNLFADDNKYFKTIRDKFGIYFERGGTIGWYLNDDALIVIDAEFPDTAENFMNGMKEKTQRKIDILFNTHHHRDHTSGNYYLTNFANKIFAQENCPVLQKKAYGDGDTAKMQVYADTTFKDEQMLDIGKEKIKARYIQPAHTGGDAMYHFQNANIAHIGDLVFNRTYPYIDTKGGGSLKSWHGYLEKIPNYFDKDTLFIFGHAPDPEFLTGKMDDIISMKNYFASLLEYVDKSIKEGKSKEEIANSNMVPNISDRKEVWNGAIKMSLNAAYDELTANAN